MKQIPIIDDSIMSSADFQSGMKFLTDLTEASIPLEYHEMVKQGCLKPKFDVCKHAYVVSNDYDFGMVRMMITVSEEDSYNNEVNVFRTYDDALQWLES